MKKLSYILIALLPVLLFSCTKYESVNCCGVGSAPHIQAVKNGEQWQALSVTQKIATDSIAISGLAQQDQLVMHIKFNGTGTYNLTGNQAKYLITPASNNISTSRYCSDSAELSTIEITNYDAAKGAITGTFSVALKKMNTNGDNTSPETVKFLKGDFSANIKN